MSFMASSPLDRHAPRGGRERARRESNEARASDAKIYVAESVVLYRKAGWRGTGCGQRGAEAGGYADGGADQASRRSVALREARRRRGHADTDFVGASATVKR